MKKIVCVLLALISLSATAQNSDEDTKGSLVILPNLQYAPETSLGLGVALFYVKKWQNDTDNRPSTQKFYPLYTLKKQISIGGSTDNWFDKNKTHFYAYLKYDYYPNDFYQIGNNSPDEKESYTSRYFEGEAYYEKEISPNLYLGLWSNGRVEKVVETQENGVLATQPIIGNDSYYAVSLGPKLTYDTRDNVLYPTDGMYHTFTARYFSNLLSDIPQFARFDLDLRQYITVNSKKHVLAYNVLYSLATRSDIPFQMLPDIGGTYVQRGFFKGRFKDTNLLVGQLDYRFPIAGRFKGIVFGSAGSVAPNFGGLFKQSPHFAGGVGLRYRLGKDGLHIRLDLAYGQAFYPYIDVLEAF